MFIVNSKLACILRREAIYDDRQKIIFIPYRTFNNFEKAIHVLPFRNTQN